MKAEYYKAGGNEKEVGDGGEKMLGRQSIKSSPEGLIGFSNLAKEPLGSWFCFCFGFWFCFLSETKNKESLPLLTK